MGEATGERGTIRDGEKGGESAESDDGKGEKEP